MIIGAHSIIYSKNSEADRAFLKDVLGFPYVDAGDGSFSGCHPPRWPFTRPARTTSTNST
jgi:hypothetical protein